mmetsp:Transcript_15849/g.26658  ORF Transcript_15849/g.26658 Transcript_15849/m.26658 type:complete len:286 (+) Transcript_15849:227-1084(+)
MGEGKQAQEECANSGGSGDGIDSSELVDIQQLERGFSDVSHMLRDLDADALAQLDGAQLMKIVERRARGENAVLPGGRGFFKTNATVVNVTPAAADNISASVKPLAMNTTHVNPLPAIGSSHNRTTTEKDAMSGEVKRISLAYNEEKQKLDLMMKIQQTRQRQSLQRKLFEKNQRKQHAQQQHERAQAAAGAHGHMFEVDDSAPSSPYNSIDIGANRGLSALKLRQSPSGALGKGQQQPSFRGLPAEAYGQQGKGFNSGSAGTSNSAPQKSMLSRGLSLGPMMRK